MAQKTRSEIVAARADRKGVTAANVRRTPYTTHGWRPTSAVNQPVRVAMKGRGKLKKVSQSRNRLRSMRCTMFW